MSETNEDRRTLDWYQAEARRTAPRPLETYPGAVCRAYREGLYSSQTAWDFFRHHDVLIWALGLTGEAGEVADYLKKVHGHGKAYEPEKLKNELGDVLWYLANLADAHGFKLSEVAQANVRKLRARYPTGFTVAAAQSKADERPADSVRVGYPAGGMPVGDARIGVEKIVMHPVDANGSPVEICGEAPTPPSRLRPDCVCSLEIGHPGVHCSAEGTWA